MGCRHSWSLSCLISAFLQLFITFVLLSCSALVFFLTNFLSFFGLSLPCQHSLCFHTLLSQHHNHYHNHNRNRGDDADDAFHLEPSSFSHPHDDDDDDDDAFHLEPTSFSHPHTFQSPHEPTTLNHHDPHTHLKHSLELEQSARAALCAELEQERIAAATAADEAMAMISRLQEERASLQIQARQYQRILEEKSAYDAEEMAILKDIIVTRETQIHFLEKQIQDCAMRFQENQLQDTKEYYDIMESHSGPSFTEKLPPPECTDTNMDKGKESPESCSMFHDADEAAQETRILSPHDMLFQQNVVGADQDQGPHVHDVHIVASKYNTCDRDVENMPSGASKFPRECGSSDSHKVEASSNYGHRVDLGINKSCSDMAERFSSLSTSPSGSLFSEQRQNSLSWVDQERLKIDGEIGCLRARLWAVQREKEKLQSTLQSQEQGQTELRLLEDIAVLLREIRHLREPEKIARQASLPPLSSKETSKRRRSRSTCVGGVGQSSSS